MALDDKKDGKAQREKVLEVGRRAINAVHSCTQDGWSRTAHLYTQ
jgi:hypothetical protein